MSRNGLRQTGSGVAEGGAESGGCSVRNAVVASPARKTGWATSQRRNGRLVVTPVTSVAVLFGFMQAEVLYAGAAPGLVTGGAQVNVRIPPTTLSLLPIYIRTGTTTSQMLATVAVRP